MGVAHTDSDKRLDQGRGPDTNLHASLEPVRHTDRYQLTERDHRPRPQHLVTAPADRDRESSPSAITPLDNGILGSSATCFLAVLASVWVRAWDRRALLRLLPLERLTFGLCLYTIYVYVMCMFCIVFNCCDIRLSEKP